MIAVLWCVALLPALALGQPCCYPSPHEGTTNVVGANANYTEGPPANFFLTANRYAYDRENSRLHFFYDFNPVLHREIRTWEEEGEIRRYLFDHNGTCVNFVVSGVNTAPLDFCVPEEAALNLVFTLGSEYGPLEQWVHAPQNMSRAEVYVYFVNPESCQINQIITGSQGVRDETAYTVSGLTVSNMTLGIEDDSIWDIPDECEDIDPLGLVYFDDSLLPMMPLLGVDEKVFRKI